MVGAFICLLSWLAVGWWAFNEFWQILSWHPLAKAVCFNDLEVKLADIHATHRATRAAFVFLLDCCREHRQFGRWHRWLLWLRGFGSPVCKQQTSGRNTRPNFFTLFACESGRLAFYNPSLHGFLVSAFLQTLRDCGSRKCTLDYVFEGICSHMKNLKTSYGLGRQKPCIYSTAYPLSKRILFLEAVITLLPPIQHC